MWECEGDKVLYVKSYKNEKGNLQARTLAERFEQLFGIPVKILKTKRINKRFVFCNRCKKFWCYFCRRFK